MSYLDDEELKLGDQNDEDEEVEEDLDLNEIDEDLLLDDEDLLVDDDLTAIDEDTDNPEDSEY